MSGLLPTYDGKPLRCSWPYLDGHGALLGHVARYQNGTDDKALVPYFVPGKADTWKPGAAPQPRPLFGLDSLAAADPTEPVYIVEGEKCAAALHSLGRVAVTSQGGSKAADKTDWTPLSDRARVLLLPDNDTPGQDYCRAVCHALNALERAPDLSLVMLPDVPDKGDIVDWIQAMLPDLSEWDGYTPVPVADRAGVLAALDALIQTHATSLPKDWTRPTLPTATDWPVPISLESSVLPDWPDDVFPSPVQDFVTALSKATETPPELAALLVLATLATAAQGKYRVRMKADYFEPVNLWTCVALPPGTRKTAVQVAATAPLTAWEREQREAMDADIKRAESEHKTLTERIAHFRKLAAKAKEEDLDGLRKDIARMEAELPMIPKVPQLWTEDVTPENLGTIMADNDERMAVLSDEAGIFDILAGRYSGGVPNLDIFLKGHAGSTVRVNRGSRPPVFMQRPTLSFGLSPQPDVLRGMTDKPSFRGRGLLGRFLYALPLSNLGYRALDATPLSEDVCLRYAGRITAMVNHSTNTDEQGRPCAHVLKIEPAALDEWMPFARKVEGNMREGEEYFYMTDWAGKFPGAVARIAALLHIARYATIQPQDRPIALIDMQAALRMANVLSAHALAVFDLMGADPALDGARTVLRWLKREGKDTFTFRDCHYVHKSRYPRAAELEPVMEVLMERHFIRPRVEKVAHRPSRIFEVNPAILQ